MIAFLPAALAALFAFVCGTLWGGAGVGGAALGQALLLAYALLGVREAADPWRLGRHLGWLPWAACAALAASLAASPVPRAGRVAVLLAPAFVLAVPATARCLNSETARRNGVLALLLVADAVALTGLADLAGGAERAARPLGHHQLLAGFLLLAFPLALLLIGRTRPWRGLGLVSALAIGAAVTLSRSLLGLVALAVEAASVAVASRRAWRLVLGVALLAGAAAVPRLERVVRGEDPSALARWGYLEGGWRGFAERPWLGWGPGSTPWTVAEFLEPAPAMRPAGELVGDLHSLPAQLIYELGVVGSLVVLAALVAFAVARGRERNRPDRRLARAAAVGLVGLALLACGNGAVAGVTALPLGAALVAGILVAAGGPEHARPSSPRRARTAAWIAGGWLALAALGLTKPGLAGLAYERAIEARDPGAAAVALDRAVELDPAFPLYRARSAWLDRVVDPVAGAEEARRAAEAARATAPLWLAAGVAGRQAGSSWAPDALARACALDPMGPIAPFHLAMALPGHPRAPEWMARAVASEPGLLAAVFWERHEELLAASLAQLEADARLDAGFRVELLARAGSVARGQGGMAELGLTYDGRGATAGSLWLFRRRPWRTQIGGIEVRKGQIGKLAIPSASQLETTAPAFFSRQGCLP